VNNRFNQLVTTIKTYLGINAGISLGVFLFILFFQPFPLDRFDFDNKLLFIAGLGAIIFLFLIIRIIWPRERRINKEENNELLVSSYPGDFLILVLISVASVFYLRYVGIVGITFFIVFKVVLISMASIIILRVSESFRELQYRNEILKRHQVSIQQQLGKYEDDLLNKSVEIISENRNDNLKLQISDIAFIRSADNYVEIYFREGNEFRKELIRNTLKNIEKQIKPYKRFVRCHRTCIINVHYIDKLNNSVGNYWLSLRDINEKIPVSRQYLLIIKDII
jgi:DNA-binding LytR/AlgR family response regulator